MMVIIIFIIFIDFVFNKTRMKNPSKRSSRKQNIFILDNDFCYPIVINNWNLDAGVLIFQTWFDFRSSKLFGMHAAKQCHLKIRK